MNIDSVKENEVDFAKKHDGSANPPINAPVRNNGRQKCVRESKNQNAPNLTPLSKTFSMTFTLVGLFLVWLHHYWWRSDDPLWFALDLLVTACTHVLNCLLTFFVETVFYGRSLEDLKESEPNIMYPLIFTENFYAFFQKTATKENIRRTKNFCWSCCRKTSKAASQKLLP